MSETRRQRACRIIRAAKRLGKPVRWEPKHAWGGCCCVGGLLMKADGRLTRFPNVSALGRWLRDSGVNDRPTNAAERIVLANDRGDFKTAWRIAYRALAGEP